MNGRTVPTSMSRVDARRSGRAVPVAPDVVNASSPWTGLTPQNFRGA